MKIWAKIKIKDKNKDIELVSKSLTNYIYQNGPISALVRKYKINPDDRRLLDQYTADRVAGLLMLYFTRDFQRINDIANKYNVVGANIKDIMPEIEGYIDK